jgi:hypothetical protein
MNPTLTTSPRRSTAPGTTTSTATLQVDELTDIAADLGFPTVGHLWEDEWIYELEPLWPAVCEVAALLTTATLSLMTPCSPRSNEPSLRC